MTQPSEVDLCLHHPGHDVDLRVSSHVRTLTDVWMGEVALDEAVRAGKLKLEGPRSLVRAFPSWLELSVFAQTERLSA